jgi:hypothetical protein
MGASLGVEAWQHKPDGKRGGRVAIASTLAFDQKTQELFWGDERIALRLVSDIMDGQGLRETFAATAKNAHCFSLCTLQKAWSFETQYRDGVLGFLRGAIVCSLRKSMVDDDAGPQLGNNKEEDALPLGGTISCLELLNDAWVNVKILAVSRHSRCAIILA